MVRRIPASAIGTLVVGIVGLLGYLLYGRSVAQSPDPISAAVAAAFSPALLVVFLALFLLFLFTIVALALRAGRTVRLGRGGLSIGGKRK